AAAGVRAGCSSGVLLSRASGDGIAVNLVQGRTPRGECINAPSFSHGVEHPLCVEAAVQPEPCLASRRVFDGDTCSGRVIRDYRQSLEPLDRGGRGADYELGTDLLAQFRDGSLGDNAAVSQDADPIAEPLHQIELM